MTPFDPKILDDISNKIMDDFTSTDARHMLAGAIKEINSQLQFIFGALEAHNILIKDVNMSINGIFEHLARVKINSL
jgi:hypothetical protein